jgi:lipoprotein NlpI
VQQDVRYFGVEIGPGSHRPNPADQVLQQRFGDCKDKVALLATLLRALQIPVRPVLVSTRMRDRLDGWIPSPLAFDHVIARVDLDGKVFYLDPTRSHQSGPLPARSVTGLGKGLELAAGVSGLTALPPAFDTERMRVEDRFTVRQFTEPVLLESRIVYRGDLAEGFREAIATQGITAVGDTLGAPYVRSYPQLKRLAPAVAEAVEGDDAVAIVQRFELPAFWRFPEQRALVAELGLWAPVEFLLPPKMETRRQPLAFAYPGITRQIATIKFPEDVYQQSGSRSSEDGDEHFRLVLKQSSTQREIEITAEARVATDQVEPAHWQAFSATLTKTLPKLGYVAAVSAVPLPRAETVQAELRSLEDQLRRGRLKVATATQAQSHYKVAMLTAQIEGGRLAAPLKAQALVARGIALDHVGRQDSARADFETAMALQPESLEALNAAATNAQGRGDFERAVELAGRVLERQPHDAEALGTRALSHYLAGQVDAARADWVAMLEDRSNVRRGYPLALLALATRRAGADVAALKQRYPQDLWPSDWPRAVVEQAFDGGDGRALLATAKAQKNAVEAQTEANFYLGELAASTGDLRKARDHWQSAVDYGVVEFVEYSAARQRLKDKR